MWLPEWTQIFFSETLSSDLLFDLTRPNFSLVREVIKTKILTKFHESRDANTTPVLKEDL